MLKKIGMGLVLILGLNIFYTGLAVIGNYHFGQMFHCFTSYDDNSFHIHHQWVVFSSIFDGVVWYIYSVVLVEFILAQCPKSMRGSVIGLWFCLWSLRWLIQFTIFYPFHHFMSPETSLGRGTFFLFTLTILTLIILLIYIFLAKRYKLHVREVVINIHQIAENHTINNIEQEEEWRRNASESSSDIIIISEY
uniref:Transmembrane protein n=1 Tax=Amphimedon queenslandica TaxID=400682 RepID=A0A1X7ULF6_AMPQE